MTHELGFRVSELIIRELKWLAQPLYGAAASQSLFATAKQRPRSCTLAGRHRDKLPTSPNGEIDSLLTCANSIQC